MEHHKSLVFFIWLTFFNLVIAFYLPGLAPVNYCKEEDELNNCKVIILGG